MVNSSAAALDATFSALADPTRRAILARLAGSPDASVGELARPFAISPPAISRHLRVLESAGLLARRREGRELHCRLVPGPMEDAAGWIARYTEFWEGRLDALKRYLEAPVSSKEGPSWPKTERPRRKRRRRSASRAPSAPRGSGSSRRGRTPPS